MSETLKPIPGDRGDMSLGQDHNGSVMLLPGYVEIDGIRIHREHIERSTSLPLNVDSTIIQSLLGLWGKKE